MCICIYICLCALRFLTNGCIRCYWQRIFVEGSRELITSNASFSRTGNNWQRIFCLQPREMKPGTDSRNHTFFGMRRLYNYIAAWLSICALLYRYVCGVINSIVRQNYVHMICSSFSVCGHEYRELHVSPLCVVCGWLWIAIALAFTFQDNLSIFQ